MQCQMFYVNFRYYVMPNLNNLSTLLLSQESALLDGVEVNLCLLGDPAYPLASWLMKPYPQPAHSTRARQLTQEQERLADEQESFNVYLSSGRMVIECAFGRLKGRWRKLQKRCYGAVAHNACIV